MLSPTSTEARAADHGPPNLGTTDGRYTLQTEIARGGMGRIWVADDARLARRVAIKELLEPHGGHRARFERELALTSRLEHPSIVSIQDGGTWPNGQPFYVMKLVRGESLGRVIARAHTVAERIALLPHGLAVVDALAYAHAQGIVHRDLKPDNVLVGDFGETVVIDWGLAKDLHDATPELDVGPYRDPARVGLTLGGEVLGTPAYMPPEQALGDAVDERADVYALGAVLYHLLSGERPHHGATVEEVLANVISAPPRPLATLAPGVPADLVTTVEKAMARRPEDRYANAGELALDLKRFQSGQLVGAHDYTGRQLLWRWLRKHRTPVIVAAIAAIVLVVVGAVSVERIVTAEGAAQAERQVAVEQRQLAVEHRADAEELMDFMLGDLSQKLAPIGKSNLLASVAKKAAAYYDHRPQSDSDKDRHQRVVALRNLGNVLIEQGDAAAALAEYRAAVAIAERLAAQAPNNSGWQHDLLGSRVGVGEILAKQGDTAGALDEFRSAQVIADKLAAGEPLNADWQRDLSVTHSKVGDLLAAKGDRAGALAEYRADLAIAEKLAANAPGNVERQRDLTVSHTTVAKLLASQGDTAAALGEYRAALANQEKLVSLDPSDADAQRVLSVVHSKIGDVLAAQGDRARALIEIRAALATEERLAAQDPNNSIWQRDLSIGHERVGDMLAKQHQTAAALAEYRADLTAVEKLTAHDPSNADWQRDLSIAHGKVGNMLIEGGDPAAALVEYRASFAIADKLAGLDPSNADWQSDLGISRVNIAEALQAHGDAAAALAEYRAALAILEKLGQKDPTNAKLQADIADVRRELDACCHPARAK